MSVGEKVYSLGQDGKARKGTIQAIGKGNNGKVAPTVKWNDGTTSEATFKQLKRDAHPVTAPSLVVLPAPSGPVPMDLDSAGKGKKPVICSNCGGRGHYANNCPSKPLSGHAIDMQIESENEDL
ncbi:hypothetical protein FS749_013315 [Ceratobasidium sp. UAMH 11750]|nr:hypothetical protein FS749_013315 [Ceratobasidium sp. UAMH 11750]